MVLRKFNVLDTRPPDNESGLTYWWTFDGHYYDVSGNGNAAIPFTTISVLPSIVADGKIGAAYSGGSTDFAKTTLNQGTSSLNTIVTTMGWFKTATASGAAIIAMNSAQNGGGASFDRTLYLGNDGKLRGYVFQNSLGTYVTSTATYNDNNWHHAALVINTFAGAGSIALYVDGAFVASTATSTAAYTGYASSFWVIGYGQGSPASLTGAVDTGFIGLLDDVRVYRRALSADDIFAIYNNGLAYGQGQPEGELPLFAPGLVSPGTGLFDRGRAALRKFSVLEARPPDNEAGLVVWYPFDDGTATDYSGRQNYGILNGTITPTSGMILNAANFGNNVTTNYFTFPSIQPFTLATATSPITVAAWISSVSGSLVILGLRATNGNAVLDFLYKQGVGVASVQIRDDGNGGFTEVNGSKLLFGANAPWHHVVWTRTSAKLWTIYVDGVVDGTPASDGITTSVTPDIAHSALGHEFLQPTWFAPNAIDDFRVYNRALGPDEVYALYAQGLAYGQGQPEGELPAFIAAAAGAPNPLAGILAIG